MVMRVDVSHVTRAKWCTLRGTASGPPYHKYRYLHSSVQTAMVSVEP